MTIETLQQTLTMSGPMGLLAGSALVALGASSLLTGVLLWWRRRRTSRNADRVPSTSVHVVDRYDDEAVAPAPSPAPSGPDLAEIDRRLEEVEQQLVRLGSRVDAVLRQRTQAVPRKGVRTPATRTPASTPDHHGSATPEEISLRALVGRSA